MARDLERVEQYIKIGYDKDEAIKMVDEEAKADAKAEAKAQASKQTKEDVNNDSDLAEAIANFQEQINNLKADIQNNNLNGARSEAPNTDKPEDVMTRIFGGNIDGK